MDARPVRMMLTLKASAKKPSATRFVSGERPVAIQRIAKAAVYAATAEAMPAENQRGTTIMRAPPSGRVAARRRRRRPSPSSA